MPHGARLGAEKIAVMGKEESLKREKGKLFSESDFVVGIHKTL